MGIMAYLDDIYADPLTDQQIMILKQLNLAQVVRDAGVSRFYLRKLIAGGRAPRSVHKKIIDYLETFKSDANKV